MARTMRELGPGDCQISTCDLEFKESLILTLAIPPHFGDLLAVAISIDELRISDDLSPTPSLQRHELMKVFIAVARADHDSQRAGVNVVRLHVMSNAHWRRPAAMTTVH